MTRTPEASASSLGRIQNFATRRTRARSSNFPPRLTQSAHPAVCSICFGTMSVVQANSKGSGAADDPAISMRELFEQGTRIATHRKENVFQELDKRTLSEEEEMVIKMRVEHQRKMYALFEKQVRGCASESRYSFVRILRSRSKSLRNNHRRSAAARLRSSRSSVARASFVLRTRRPGARSTCATVTSSGRRPRSRAIWGPRSAGSAWNRSGSPR